MREHLAAPIRRPHNRDRGRRAPEKGTAGSAVFGPLVNTRTPSAIAEPRPVVDQRQMGVESSILRGEEVRGAFSRRTCPERDIGMSPIGVMAPSLDDASD
jgi:hypothetical protein